MYPSRAWAETRSIHRAAAVIVVAVLVVSLGMQIPFGKHLGNAQKVSYTSVPGQSYMICDDQSQLTSPWTYNALASGSQSYTVADYEALPGYGTALPSLPSYIASEAPTTTAAVIFAPGSTVDSPQYDYPESPILYFFEGGVYTNLALSAVSGDEFIGGSATGYPEPTFDDQNNAGGINAQNGTFDFSGGSSTLAATANSGDTTVTTTTAIPGYISWITFADGSTYSIANNGGTTLTLGTALTSSESAGSAVWAAQEQPISSVSAAANQGDATIGLASSTVPLVQWGKVRIGDDAYVVNALSGSQSTGYTANVGSLDVAVAANTPVYYDGLAGGVTVSYLNIAHDSHNTTGTIYTGAGWTVTHNNIHDGYKDTGGTPTPGLGVAIYGGDQGTVEYNCLDKMGDYGVQIDGTNNRLDYNEIRDSNYEPDPGCGCSGGGKWWGTLNADIVANAFVDDSPGGGVPIWLDNGNSGTLIKDNYFSRSYGSAVHSETGFNLDIENNLFLDGGWGDGTGGCGDNCIGAVNLNSSGGFHVPNSRYDNQVTVSGNQFINNWSGISIWQAGGRTCEDSGEGWPNDAPYCSGGYPNTAVTTGNEFYFSHVADSPHGWTYSSVAQPASTGSSTVLVNGNEAIDDQIGFADPVSTTTTDTTDVTTFSGSGTINVGSTTGFPSSGQLRVGTSAAWGDGNGSWTGAILSYTGTTAASFTGVSFVRGSGTLSGPVQQVQPYKVTNSTCYANDCALTITPALTSDVSAGTSVTNAGTCQLFATSAALPSGPLAPNGTSYWDGCQWEALHIAISGNTFVVQPSLMNAGTPINGGTVQCTAANNCGVNFMADQYNSGEAPFTTEIGANAMMSQSALTGCPVWDPGCTTNPLTNLNALSSPPGAPAGNGEAAGNDIWSNNTFQGPWTWHDYIYGNCAGGGVYMPSDPGTGNSLDSTSCSVDFAGWQSDWQQDVGSTSNPMAVSLGGITSNQFIHGSSQTVTAYEDTASSNTISSSTLSLNTTAVNTVSNPPVSPHNFSLNTLNYADGLYTLKVSGTDSGGNTNDDSLPVYITNGDFNGDGKVNLSDLAILGAHWGKTDSNYAHGNITGQSTINLSDLAVLGANWGWSKP